MNPTTTASDAPTISVVIPAYGRADLLEIAVRSVLQQDLDPGEYEVLVVDSTPDDSNLRLVQSLQAAARCSLRCLTKKAEGPGPSRNLGAHSSRGRIIAFIDSDCQAAPHWLRAGMAAFDDDRVGLVQGRTIPDPTVPMTSRSRSIRVEAESMYYETANIFYRRSAFEATTGFQCDLAPGALHPFGGEDTDLAWTVKHAGWHSRFAEQALVMHAVLPITRGQWLFNKSFFVFPRLLARHPQLRQQFFARYFFDDAQAWLTIGLVGSMAAGLSPWTLLAWAPYVLRRTRDPTNARGLLKLARPLLYLPRDLCTFACLLAGSVRYRTLLL